MRPLGVVHTIDDWRTQDVPTLVANLRAALTPGELLLAHDGGGDRRGTVAALREVLPAWLAEGWRFTRPVGWDTPVPGPPAPRA
jgi:endo-1,4-beta-xylanase